MSDRYSSPDFNPTRDLADLIERARFDDLSAQAVDCAKTFLLDTLGCGVAGSSGPRVDALIGAAASWGEGGTATVWGDGRRLPAPQAAQIGRAHV